MTVQGKLSIEELRRRIDAGEITTVLAAFPDYYGRLVGKRIHGAFFMEHVVPEGMHACDYLLTVDMEMDPVPGYAFSSWETGYGDFKVVPDWETLRLASWLDATAIVLCDLVDEETQAVVAIAPRSILRRQIERVREAGYTAFGGSELEFYLFDDPYAVAREKRYEGLTRAGWYIEDYHLFQGTKEEDVVGAIRHHLHQSGIPVEFSKGEWGPGQQEINIRYAEVLEMADRHVLYKHLAKEIAWQRGKAITFMAKWHAEEAGSSCHIHLSLSAASDGIPVFAPTDAEAETLSGTSVRIGPRLRHFVGGLTAHASEIALFLAPNVNSYKRFQEGTFAPTAITWSHDNRTAAFRLIGQGSALRVECRIPGADVNPYLAYAALLAAGLDGMRKRLDPGPLFRGDAYTAPDLPHIPTTLRDAIDAARDSDFLRETFGEDVLGHLLHFAETEQRRFDRSVTDWEKVRYFERI